MKWEDIKSETLFICFFISVLQRHRGTASPQHRRSGSHYSSSLNQAESICVRFFILSWFCCKLTSHKEMILFQWLIFGSSGLNVPVTVTETLWSVTGSGAAVNQHKHQTLKKQEVVSPTSSFRFANRRRRGESETHDGQTGRPENNNSEPCRVPSGRHGTESSYGPCACSSSQQLYKSSYTVSCSANG